MERIPNWGSQTEEPESVRSVRSFCVSVSVGLLVCHLSSVILLEIVF